MGIKKPILLAVFLATYFYFTADISARTQVDYSSLQEKYGENLKSAPFFLRQKFLTDTGKSWPKASLQERGAFIQNYYAQKAQEEKQKQKQRGQKAKAEKYKQKQKYSKQRNNQMKIRQKQRAKQVEQRNEQRKKRTFSKLIQMQKKKMQKMSQR